MTKTKNGVEMRTAKETEVLINRVRSELEYFEENYGRNFFSKYLKACGAYFLASSSGGVEVIKALQGMDIEDKRKKIYRAEREFKESLMLVQRWRK